MSHIYIHGDHAVLYAQSFKFTHGTHYGSTYLASPILTPCSIQSLDDGVETVYLALLQQQIRIWQAAIRKT